MMLLIFCDFEQRESTSRGPLLSNIYKFSEIKNVSLYSIKNPETIQTFSFHFNCVPMPGPVIIIHYFIFISQPIKIGVAVASELFTACASRSESKSESKDSSFHPKIMPGFSSNPVFIAVPSSYFRTSLIRPPLI